MKKMHFVFACVCLTAGLFACNDGTNTTTATTTTTDSNAANTSNNTNNDNNSSGTNIATGEKLPLTAQDSTFVMKAAMGGMMEVQAGNAAQQNAQHDRVKAFATMMVRDHSGANQELMSLAQGRGMVLPTDLPPDMKKHTDALKNMKGRAFDNHYMKMMVDDHQKTIADFEKQVNGGNDAELKAWAAKMLPALQMHRDSAVAINNAIK